MGIKQGAFPFTYLGYPVFYGRMRIYYFNDLVKKIQNKVFTWQNKWLSFDGKYILIQNVLQSIPIYLLSALNPPKKVIERIHQVFAQFFWGRIGGEKGKHCVSWEDMCYPQLEGGLGFRSLFDVSRAFYAKLWWRFRTATTLWSNYMWTRYCKKLHPVIENSKEASHVWKRMVAIREDVEMNMWWQYKEGAVNIWFDNWTKQEALYFLGENNVYDEDMEVQQCIRNKE